MGYSLELGYAKERIEHSSRYTELNGFEAASVTPFTGGSVVATEPDIDGINKAPDIVPYEYGVDIFAEPTDFQVVRAIDNSGLVKASIDITFNYSPRILEIAGTHLADLHGVVAVEAAPTFMQLIAKLGDDTDFEDYWNATDGNIKHLAKTLLDWTFQHPDGVFCSID